MLFDDDMPVHPRRDTLTSKREVELYRKRHRIPEDEPCPRWLDCSCRLGEAGKVDAEKRGAVQRMWGHMPYCLKCGALM